MIPRRIENGHIMISKPNSDSMMMELRRVHIPYERLSDIRFEGETAVHLLIPNEDDVCLVSQIRDRIDSPSN